jgi:hypothetical protein
VDDHARRASTARRDTPLNFLPPTKKFTASVTGTDRAKVEQVATSLLAKLEKM